MNSMRSLLLTLVALIGLTVTSCIDDDFSTSSTDVLTFSTDTLSFDTVFTDLGTPTARLKVYNRAKKSINISSISMREATSCFSMNVDGQSGRDFHDVEIRGGDSIFIFVECKLPTSAQNKPQLTEDAIVFLTNGVTQQVQLEAWGQNVHRLRGQTLRQDTRLTAEIPYIVFDSLVVDPGVTLTVEPGAQLLFHDKAELVVYGTLNAVGERGKMIDMRGDRLDNVLPDVAYDIMAGQWHGIYIAPESYGNRLEFVDMRSTVAGLQLDSCADASRSKLYMLNSWLHNSQNSVLTANNAKLEAYGCCFSEAASHVVAFSGGDLTFDQCTFANNYLFAVPYASIVGLYHCLPVENDPDTRPLMKAEFRNSIIYGMGGELNEGDLTGSQVFFRYVLLGSEGQNDDNFLNCIWGEDPLFYTVREDYIFNYRVRPDSPAIKAGNAAFVQPFFQYDMYGVNRLGAGAPTLGAFQYVAPEE